MRNRANASSIPFVPPQPSPIPPYVPPKRSKYDDLVDVLADGLFEMVLDGDVPMPLRKRRRARSAAE
jgi:hypothetical protein